MLRVSTHATDRVRARVDFLPLPAISHRPYLSQVSPPPPAGMLRLRTRAVSVETIKALAASFGGRQEIGAPMLLRAMTHDFKALKTPRRGFVLRPALDRDVAINP